MAAQAAGRTPQIRVVRGADGARVPRRAGPSSRTGSASPSWAPSSSRPASQTHQRPFPSSPPVHLPSTSLHMLRSCGSWFLFPCGAALAAAAAVAAAAAARLGGLDRAAPARPPFPPLYSTLWSRWKATVADLGARGVAAAATAAAAAAPSPAAQLGALTAPSPLRSAPPSLLYTLFDLRVLRGVNC